ncbi:hypothetical protein LAZ43_23560, partial [Vibrio alginolyticus]|nr:hypothetical protein [Vibrio alginolyticus]MDW2161477.1 hypothetical protein [Vibrio sp. 1942]MDW2227020.1 hypothetical protein [Vibrio sp. 1761]
THCWTSNLSMEVLKNTENDLQIDLRPIDCCVIAPTSEVRKLRTQCATNSLNMGMFVNFPCHIYKLYKKLDVHSRHDAVKLVRMNNGLTAKS